MPSGVVAETTSYNKTFVNRSGEDVAVMQLLPRFATTFSAFLSLPNKHNIDTATVPELGGFFFFDSTRNPRVMDAQAKAWHKRCSRKDQSDHRRIQPTQKRSKTGYLPGFRE